MAEQEEPKNAVPGQAPTPIKLHTSGLAGTTQHLSHPVDTADRTATVPIAKVSVGGKPMPKPSPSAVPTGAPAGEAADSNDKTMRLRKNPTPTIKLMPSGGTPASAQTIKLTPQTSAQTVSPVKPVAPSASAAPQTIKISGAEDTENAHTVRIARPPHTGQGIVPVSEPSAGVKPTSTIPGAKQTIKLRPSSTGSIATGMPSQTGGPVKLGATPANKTIKLAPLGGGGIKVVPQTPAAQQKPPVPAAPLQQAAPASGSAAPAAAPGSAPRMSQTLKLSTPSSAGSDKKPIGGKTMKLSLHKPAGTPAAGTAGGPAKVPELKLPGKKEDEAAAAASEAAASTEEKPNIVFFLISIAAMLFVVFTVLLMTVQFANMYHGADVNIPGMTRLSGGSR